MNQLLHPDYSELQYDKSLFTATEIANQPKTWEKVWEKIHQETKKISSFLKPLAHKPELNIVLTGAGSSAFIGSTVSSMWLKNFSCPTQAIPTTDLVTHFKDQVATNKPLLLISFARSGNSPESTATLQHANAYCEEVYHLIITCNPDGKLAQMGDRENSYVFLLPAEAEDQSLAMTNSFTSMALAATIIPFSVKGKTENIDRQIELLVSYGHKIIDDFTALLHEVAETAFERIVFLGSGPLWGIAKESHLKVQELTNGRVIGKFDSFLGFRHGPKAIIDEDTLLVYLLSNNAYTSRYEKDLIQQVARHNINLTTLGITETNSVSTDLDFCINIEGKGELDEHLWAIACTLPAQIIGFYKSLLLGYNPDNPSPNGTIARVVEGVTIYDNNASKSSNS